MPIKTLPKHLAIIMDGNGRWAQARNLPVSEGHKAGILPLRHIVEKCVELGIPALTVFAFSSENWQRPDKEVNALMSLFVESLTREIDELHANSVQLRVIGGREKFSKDLKEQMAYCEKLTACNTRLVFTIAVDYGGRWDITQAAKVLAQEVAEGKLSPADINEDLLNHYMANSDLSEPDLCIRTGGEYRISNFLIWQFAYTEFMVNDCFWPDYSLDKFMQDLTNYAARERRFGKRN